MDVTDTRNLPWDGLRTALFAVLVELAAQTLWAAEPRIAFDIPAGDFSQAIIEFYKQTQVEILYASAGSVGELKTRAVMGTFEVAEALRRLLEGTGFTFEFENPRSVLLKRELRGSANRRGSGSASPESSRSPMLPQAG